MVLLILHGYIIAQTMHLSKIFPVMHKYYLNPGITLKEFAVECPCYRNINFRLEIFPLKTIIAKIMVLNRKILTLKW